MSAKSLSTAIPLGTIISSMLDYDQFREADQENPNASTTAFSAGLAFWAPCDGRSITGSQLEQQFSISNAPDLRGKFLRGLNLMDEDGEPEIDMSQANPDDTNRDWDAGTYQGDAFHEHKHGITGKYLEADGGNGFFGHGFDSNSYHMDDHSNDELVFTHHVSDDTSASWINKDETRPRNISVFFYIKINQTVKG